MTQITKKPIKAVSLISGGLDSLLSTKLIIDQGVHVEGINFFTGFCVEGHTHAIRKQKKDKPKRNNALWVAEQLGVKLHIIDVIEEYRDVLLNPKHGYGKNMNPCLDCKGFMVKKAKEWMLSNNFDFITIGNDDNLKNWGTDLINFFSSIEHLLINKKKINFMVGIPIKL